MDGHLKVYYLLRGLVEGRVEVKDGGYDCLPPLIDDLGVMIGAPVAASAGG